MHPNRKSNVAATLQTKDKDNQYNTEEIRVFKNNKHCGDRSKNNLKEQNNKNMIGHHKNTPSSPLFLDVGRHKN